MEIAVKVNENAESKGLYRSMPIKIEIICINPPKASIKIELDDLFMKNTTSGRIPRLKIRTRSGINPANIPTYMSVNSMSSGVGAIGKIMPGIKKSIQYHRIAIVLPIIRRLTLLILSSFFINILATKNMIKEISAMISGINGSRK